jgi:hypothetical protein
MTVGLIDGPKAGIDIDASKIRRRRTTRLTEIDHSRHELTKDGIAGLECQITNKIISVIP